MLIVFLVKFYLSTKCRSLGNTALGSLPGLLKGREMVMGVQGVGSTLLSQNFNLFSAT